MKTQSRNEHLTKLVLNYVNAVSTPTSGHRPGSTAMMSVVHTSICGLHVS